MNGNHIYQCIQHKEQAIYLEKELKGNQRMFYCQNCIDKIQYPHNLLLIKDVEAFIHKHEQIILKERKIINQQNLELLLRLKEQLFQFQSQLSQLIEQNVQYINEQIKIIIAIDESLEQKTKEAFQKIIYENFDIENTFEELVDYRQIKKTIACSLMPMQTLSFQEQQQKFLKEIRLQSKINSLEQIKDFFKQQQEKQLIRNQRCKIHQLQVDIINITSENQQYLGCIKCDFNFVVQRHNLEDLKEYWNKYQRHTEKYIGFHQKANSSLELLNQHKIALNLLINQFNQLIEPNEDRMDEIQKKTSYLIKKDWSDMTNEDILSIAKILNNQNNHLILDDTIQAEIEANQIQIRQFCQNQIQMTDQIKQYYQLATINNVNYTQSILTQFDNKQKTLVDAKNLISGKQYELINSFKENECKAIAFSSDSVIMIAGYFNGLINIYEFKLGFLKLIQQLQQHRNMITCLNFMKKSMSFISGSKDMTIIIWMIQDKQNWQIGWYV
ncbi:unnamed protein product [Paramecium pentaurelia]|uniref:WD40-repeat-containing domain n=1 Tax=Paramecium pentaurelia TaxID=43138 RepID=A0A8S1T2I2_9CILI|nr:unnamed protein product [Paramecium pentaurelia]